MSDLEQIVIKAFDRAGVSSTSHTRTDLAKLALSALRAEGALVGSKLAAEIGNAFTGFPKCHMFVRYKSDGLGEPHDEGSYYAIKIQDKGPSINFGMTELALELFANEALSRIEADRATNTQEGEQDGD